MSALAGGLAVSADDLSVAWQAEHYTKFEYRIPMRDGVRLFTRVDVPKEDSQTWPILLTRTPYACKPYGPDNYTDPAGLRLGGYQQLVRGEVFRGKFRNSFERPELFTPGQVTKVEFTRQDICHTFRAGHRVMVQVQSSWFPLVDRNPQTFVNIPTARPEDFPKATHRVYRSATHASALAVNVLPGPAAPTAPWPGRPAISRSRSCNAPSARYAAPDAAPFAASARHAGIGGRGGRPTNRLDEYPLVCVAPACWGRRPSGFPTARRSKSSEGIVRSAGVI